MKNGYELSRAMFDFAYEHTECRCVHIALYLWLVELNNRLDWKDEFGLPTVHTMERLSIGDRKVYLAALHDLEKWKFLKIVSPSKNQNTATVISLIDMNGKKGVKGFTQGDTQGNTQADPQTGTQSDTQADPPIDKQLNTKTIKPLNVEEVIAFFTEKGYTESIAKKFFDYYEASGWIDGNGRPVLNWKQKAVKVWFKDEHKIPATVFDFGPLNQKIEDDDYVKSKLEALRQEKNKNQDSPSA